MGITQKVGREFREPVRERGLLYFNQGPGDDHRGLGGRGRRPRPGEREVQGPAPPARDQAGRVVLVSLRGVEQRRAVQAHLGDDPGRRHPGPAARRSGSPAPAGDRADPGAVAPGGWPRWSPTLVRGSRAGAGARAVSHPLPHPFQLEFPAASTPSRRATPPRPVRSRHARWAQRSPGIRFPAQFLPAPEPWTRVRTRPERGVRADRRTCRQLRPQPGTWSARQFRRPRPRPRLPAGPW